MRASSPGFRDVGGPRRAGDGHNLGRRCKGHEGPVAVDRRCSGQRRRRRGRQPRGRSGGRGRLRRRRRRCCHREDGHVVHVVVDARVRALDEHSEVGDGAARLHRHGARDLGPLLARDRLQDAGVLFPGVLRDLQGQLEEAARRVFQLDPAGQLVFDSGTEPAVHVLLDAVPACGSTLDKD